MTDVASPPPATERACPRCGASLAPDQEWCLNCGAAVGSTIAPAPRWRAPVLIVGGLLALLVAALALALIELSGDPQPVAKAPQPTPAPTVAATPTPATTPEPGATPDPAATADPDASATPDPGASATGEPAEWPSDRTAFTVVIASSASKAQADRRARRELEGGGADVGVLNSDDYSSLRKGFWVVFSGQYESRKEASDAADARGGEAYARRVVPR